MREQLLRFLVRISIRLVVCRQAQTLLQIPIIQVNKYKELMETGEIDAIKGTHKHNKNKNVIHVQHLYTAYIYTYIYYGLAAA